MNDYYNLGNVPKNISSVELGDLNTEIIALSNKVLLIELNDEAYEKLKHMKSDDLKNCIFLYHSEQIKNETKWFKIFNTFKPFMITKSSSLTNKILEDALKGLRLIDQKNSLKQMKQEHQKFISKNLSTLKSATEKSRRSLKRAMQISFEEELNLKTLEVIFDACSLGEIEDHLLEVLRQTLNLKWLRILLSPNQYFQESNIISKQMLFNTLNFDLEFEQNKKGVVFFAFDSKIKIKNNTKLFLQRLSDALSLRIKQFSIENDIETSSHQWESTFKALPFKTAIIDKNYNVVQVGGEFKDLKTKGLCYETFFGKNKPCIGCKLGESFLIDQKNESLEVNSNEIFDPLEDDFFYINFYRDFEVSTLTESRKATKAKLEELGIISGSIAHELNNPLGGIKILLELLKEDLNESDSETLEDLTILKESTESCIETVQELLDFTRPQKNYEPTEKSLDQFFNQLQTFTKAHLRSEGFILQKAVSDIFNMFFISKDSILLIKLLESLSQFTKQQKKSNETQIIYFYPELVTKNEMNLHFSLDKLNFVSKSIDKTNDPIEITYSDSHFEKSNRSLTLNFTLQVKPSQTHV